MSGEPQISFLIPVFNMAETLPDALGNLFLIRDFSIEIIVINDGSTDSTEEVIGRWKETSDELENIIFQSINIPNCGRAEALNRGAGLALGTYLSFVDADDLIDPDELVKLRDCAKSDQTDLVLGQFKVITEGGKQVAARSLQPDITKKQLIYKIAFSPIAPIHLNAALISRKLFLESGGFDQKLIRSQDKDLTVRLLNKVNDFSICNSWHYLYRKHPMSKKETVKKRLEWLHYRQKMIRKNFNGLIMISSMFLQFSYDTAKLFYESITR